MLLHALVKNTILYSLFRFILGLYIHCVWNNLIFPFVFRCHRREGVETKHCEAHFPRVSKNFPLHCQLATTSGQTTNYVCWVHVIDIVLPCACVEYCRNDRQNDKTDEWKIHPFVNYERMYVETSTKVILKNRTWHLAFPNVKSQ